MNQKREIKMSKDFDLEHSTGEYHKVSLDNLKEKLESWLNWNMDLLDKQPEFHIKEEDKKLFLKVTEEGGEDFMDDGTEYYMILKPLKDEDEVEVEIGKEEQKNLKEGVLVRETFPFPIGE